MHRQRSNAGAQQGAQKQSSLPELIDALLELADVALSRVGRAYTMLPDALARECYPDWLIREFRRLRREEFDAHILAIQAMEVGVGRALVTAFGEQPEELPRWDAVECELSSEEDPEWVQRYREANRLPAPLID